MDTNDTILIKVGTEHEMISELLKYIKEDRCLMVEKVVPTWLMEDDYMGIRWHMDSISVQLSTI